MGFRVLSALLALHAAALYLFTTGFFLTRFEVPDLSSCHASPSDGSATSAHLRGGLGSSNADADAAEGCWMPRRFRRVVFVVIDALRFDFAASGSAAKRSTFYSGRLPILNATIAKEPEHALLLKFVADPPTMTMQRLKGLTTGSLPTFLDIKDNMAASSQIIEDNLLRQLREQKRGVVFMGDDTWDALYAREFTRKFAFDSFNVKDLHSVDRGVTAHLFPELRKPDWDLLIAHFLGVDHVGHTHGPSSVFMTEKLDEMNGVLADLLQELRVMPDGDDVLLAVLGDHGMSADGNHGGASDEETGAALFLYSKAPLIATDEGDERDNDDAEEMRKYAARILDGAREVPQVDLVPTLALLSGLPIPFGNLGSIIPPLFFMPPSPPTSRIDCMSSTLAAFQALNRALQLNLGQVRRYLFRYSSASKLPERAYEHLEKLLVDITRIEEQLQQGFRSESSPTSSKADLPLLLRLHEDLAQRQQAYLREALALGRSIWTQFDLCSMCWGMLILSWTFLVEVLFTNSANPALKRGSMRTLLAVAAIFGGLFLLCPASINLPLLPTASLSRALVAASCASLIHISWCIASSRKNEVGESIQRSQAHTLPSVPAAVGVVTCVVVVLHALGLLSNSYIVAEGNVMQFLSATTGFFLLFSALRLGFEQNNASSAAIVFIVATRMSSALEPPNIIKSTATLWRTFLPLAATVLLMISSIKQVTSRTGQRLSSFGRLMLIFSVVSCCLCATFWAASPIKVAVWRLWLPRLVYLNFVCSLCSLFWRTARPSRGGKPIDGNCSTVDDALMLLWQLAPAFMLVLGPTSPLSVLCMALQFKSFVYVAVCCRPSASNRSKMTTADGVDASQHHSQASITPWVLLLASCSYQTFFTTGHANTFTSLQNAAGFVGFDNFNFYAAGVLLGLNTFGCFALGVLALHWLNLSQQRLKFETTRMALAFSVYFTLNTLVSTLFVALQRRHLMVWAIFAPKFIFDGLVLLITEALLLVMFAPF